MQGIVTHVETAAAKAYTIALLPPPDEPEGKAPVQVTMAALMYERGIKAKFIRTDWNVDPDIIAWEISLVRLALAPSSSSYHSPSLPLPISLSLSSASSSSSSSSSSSLGNHPP
jgi:hypothetical protein